MMAILTVAIFGFALSGCAGVFHWAAHDPRCRQVMTELFAPVTAVATRAWDASSVLFQDRRRKAR